jgi:hypothetical protein
MMKSLVNKILLQQYLLKKKVLFNFFYNVVIDILYIGEQSKLL